MLAALIAALAVGVAYFYFVGTPTSEASPQARIEDNGAASEEITSELAVPSTSGRARALDAPAVFGDGTESRQSASSTGHTAGIPLRRDLHEDAYIQIPQRQEAVLENYAYVFEGKEIVDGARMFTKIENLVLQAMMAEMDANGRANFHRLPGESNEQCARRRIMEMQSGGDSSLPPGATRLSSGAADYEISPGDFPAYDAIRALSAEFGFYAPIDRVPLDEVRKLADRVLAYRVP